MNEFLLYNYNYFYKAKLKKHFKSQKIFLTLPYCNFVYISLKMDLNLMINAHLWPIFSYNPAIVLLCVYPNE